MAHPQSFQLALTRREQGRTSFSSAFAMVKVAHLEEPLEDIHVELDQEGNVLTIEVIGADNTSAAELM